MDPFFKQVYEKVKLIPKGKVTTYRRIAMSLGSTDGRKIGWAMSACKDESVPCHRVVKMNGELSGKFSIGGTEQQKQLLENEGIEFTSENPYIVDLEKYLFEFN